MTTIGQPTAGTLHHFYIMTMAVMVMRHGGPGGVVCPSCVLKASAWIRWQAKWTPVQTLDQLRLRLHMNPRFHRPSMKGYLLRHSWELWLERSNYRAAEAQWQKEAEAEVEIRPAPRPVDIHPINATRH